jgi:hypothetical protein
MAMRRMRTSASDSSLRLKSLNLLSHCLDSGLELRNQLICSVGTMMTKRKILGSRCLLKLLLSYLCLFLNLKPSLKQIFSTTTMMTMTKTLSLRRKQT